MPKLSEVSGSKPVKLSQVAKPDFSNVQASIGPTVKAKPRKKPAYAMPGLGSVAEAQGGFADALQHHLLNIPIGIAQAGANSGDWLGDKMGIADSGNSFADRMNRWVAEREANYQKRVTGTPASNMAGNVGAAVGEVLPWMTGIGELRAAGMLPKITGRGLKATAKKGGALAVEGGSIMAVQPVTQGDYGTEKAQQVAVGAVTSPLAAGVAGGTAAAGRYLTPSGRDAIANARLAEMFGSDPQTLARLQAQSPVPGFRPTIAQALATPEAVQAERILRNQGATAPAFSARESANNAAIRSEAGALAGTDADMAAARAARTAATAPYYASLEGQAVDPAPVIQALDALASSSLGVRPNIKAAANSLRSEIMSRIGSDGKIDASILSGVRENASSHLGPKASAQEKRALGPVADSIADTLDRAIPGYRANLAAYASASSPIRDMEAGRALVDAIDRGGRDAGGGQVVTLPVLKSLLAKDDKARFKMSPQARARAEAMLAALQQRSVTNNTVAASGPGTAADNMRGFSGSPVGQRLSGGILALLGGAFGGADAGITALLANEGALALNNNVMRRVGTKAADASIAAQAIEAYQRSQNPSLTYSPLLRMLPYNP